MVTLEVQPGKVYPALVPGLSVTVYPKVAGFGLADETSCSLFTVMA